MKIKEIEISQLEELKEKSMMLKDERQKGKKKFLKLTEEIPTAKTYERVISIIDSQELNKIFVEFVKNIQFMDDKFFKDILSFDGKIDKRNARRKGYIVEATKPLNVLNVTKNTNYNK